MTRAFALAAVLMAGFALPTFAADNSFTEENAREHLLRLGYSNVSTLQKDAHGNWAGTAIKDGKTIPVAVGVKPAAPTVN